MRSRCNNPNAHNYPQYGGAGKTHPKSWNRYEKFLADLGERPPGTSLHRINNEIGYSRSNCCWAPLSVQAKNRRGWKQKPRRSNLADIQAFAASLARAA
jgi:hypothetical protein